MGWHLAIIWSISAWKRRVACGKRNGPKQDGYIWQPGSYWSMTNREAPRNKLWHQWLDYCRFCKRNYVSRRIHLFDGFVCMTENRITQNLSNKIPAKLCHSDTKRADPSLSFIFLTFFKKQKNKTSFLKELVSVADPNFYLDISDLHECFRLLCSTRKVTGVLKHDCTPFSNTNIWCFFSVLWE